MPKKLRLGLLGTGVAAHHLYLPALARLKDRVELVACASRRYERALAFARKAKVGIVARSPGELFSLPEVEAVMISLPIDRQAEWVLEALRRGKPVMSEKPVGPSVVLARRLIRAARRYDVPWLVGENFAFFAPARYLARWREEGALGELRLVEVHQMTQMDAKNPYYHTTWRKKPAHVGGFVVDGGVHLAHVVRRCFGEPQVKRSMVQSFDPGLPPIDTAVALLQFEAGALGTWTSCFSAPQAGPILRVWGSRGRADLGWDYATLVPYRGRVKHFSLENDTFVRQFSHFRDVVQRGVPSCLTPESALADLALVEAIAHPGPARK